MRTPPFQAGDKICVVLNTRVDPMPGTIEATDEKGFCILPPNQTGHYILWKNMLWWTKVEWRGPFNPEEPVDAKNPLDLFCQNCWHPVGNPVRPDQPHAKASISEKDLMICVKCLEMMRGTNEGKLRILTPKERGWLFATRGQEICLMMQASIKAEEFERLSRS